MSTFTFPVPHHRYARVLSIAGSDSGGGAGIQADLKTFSALGCYGMTAITALTAQNTLGVSSIHPVPPEFLKAQIQAVIEDIGVDAVKIGMLHSPEIVRVVAWAISHYKLTQVVLDPVMVATSGDRLIESATVQVLQQELFPLVSVITRAPSFCARVMRSAQAPSSRETRPAMISGRWAPNRISTAARAWAGSTFWVTLGM